MAQSWHDVLFAHWTVPHDVIRRHVPDELEIDTHDGAAWVGVIAFWMSGVRLRCLPPLPSFPELNVRTYVRRDGEPGVRFLSLDAASRLAVVTARAWFGLPYHAAAMSCTPRDGGFRYASRRRDGTAAFGATYRPTGDAAVSRPGSLEHFLVERYTLFAGERGELRGDVRHPPWPLSRAEATIEENTMFTPLDGDPVLHFATRMDVRVGRPRRVSAP